MKFNGRRFGEPGPPSAEVPLPFRSSRRDDSASADKNLCNRGNPWILSVTWPNPISSNCRVASRFRFFTRTARCWRLTSRAAGCSRRWRGRTPRAICRRPLNPPSPRAIFGRASRGLKFLRHVHRLDADTSGVLLFAKSPGAVEMLFRFVRGPEDGEDVSGRRRRRAEAKGMDLPAQARAGQKAIQKNEGGRALWQGMPKPISNFWKRAEDFH